MGCPDEETLLAFAGGTLSETERQIAEVHIDRCASCRWLLARLALGTSASHEATAPAPADARPSCPTTRPDRRQVPSTADTLKTGDPALDPALLPAGTVIDQDYVIHSQIGCGGMGSVYLATDRRLQRPVAVKVINRDLLLSSSDLVERFVFEARVTARFNHPNIISVYGAGEFEGRPYLVLEYVAGETLRQRMLTGEPWTLPEAIGIAVSLARALAEAHDHSVLHRDLKPGNVMVAPDGRVRVLDFGLARLLEAQPAERDDGEQQRSSLAALHCTRTEGFKGTPRYMAPEQWRGGTVTRATDVWALGVILFELTFRRHPFDIDDLDTLRQQVVSAEPVPVALVGRPHGDLRRIISACLNKDPSERPSAEQLVRWIERVPRSSRSKRRYLGAALIVPLLVLIGALAGNRIWRGPGADTRTHGRPADAPDAGQAAAPDRQRARRLDAKEPAPARRRTAPRRRKPAVRRRSAARPRRAFGRINIQAIDGVEPRAVVVVMDGKVVGETPLQLFRVKAGSHYLTIRHDAYHVARRRVRLKRAEKRTVLFRLRRRAP